MTNTMAQFKGKRRYEYIAEKMPYSSKFWQVREIHTNEIIYIRSRTTAQRLAKKCNRDYSYNLPSHVKPKKASYQKFIE
jgi:hypothetical protein